jgi:hypothetical protein
VIAAILDWRLADRLRSQRTAKPHWGLPVVADRATQRLEEYGSEAEALLPGLGRRADLLHATFACIEMTRTRRDGGQ